MNIDIDGFRDYLRSYIAGMQGNPPDMVLRITPYLAIRESNRRWYVQGFCRISGPFPDSVFVGRYEAKSELEVDLHNEGRMFADLLHLQLQDMFSELGVMSVKYIFEPSVQLNPDG